MIMLWLMNSKDMNLFLNNERDEKILDAQYVIVSNRIRKSSKTHDNIITANVLFPDSESALSYMNSEENDVFREKYFEQLDENKTLLALLIKTAIIDDANIIFLCTKNEEKLGHYLRLIGEYIYNEFDYPVYRYKDLAKGRVKLISYDEAKVYNTCLKVIKKAKDKDLKQKILNDYKLSDKNKKKLKRLLKDNDLYKKGMSVHEMKNIAEVFLLDN